MAKCSASGRTSENSSGYKSHRRTWGGACRDSHEKALTPGKGSEMSFRGAFLAWFSFGDRLICVWSWTLLYWCESFLESHHPTPNPPYSYCYPSYSSSSLSFSFYPFYLFCCSKFLWTKGCPVLHAMSIDYHQIPKALTIIKSQNHIFLHWLMISLSFWGISIFKFRSRKSCPLLLIFSFWE